MPLTPNSKSKPAGSFRMLHTADWHLGKLLNDQSRDLEHELFLEWLLEVIEQHQVDAILLAGDVFDTANPPQSALSRYYNFVSKLNQLEECSLAVIAGNHDSAAQLEAPKQVLHALNTHVIGSMPEDPIDRILLLPNKDHPRVSIAMIPFLRDRDLRVGKAGEGADDIRAQIVSGIQQRYEEAAKAAALGDSSYPMIAMGHLTVLGSSTSDSERDIHIGGLGAVTADSFPNEFCSVALGHLHRPQAPKTSNQGVEHVRYAGSPIALSFSESTDNKEVRLLDIINNEITQQGLPIPVFRGLAQIRVTSADLEQALDEFTPQASALPTWVEVIVEDATIEDDLNQRVQDLAEGKNFEVLKVLRGNVKGITSMEIGNATDDEAIESLLDKPNSVFDHLLNDCSEFDDTEKDELKRAFATLVEADTQA